MITEATGRVCYRCKASPTAHPWPEIDTTWEQPGDWYQVHLICPECLGTTIASLPAAVAVACAEDPTGLVLPFEAEQGYWQTDLGVLDDDDLGRVWRQVLEWAGPEERWALGKLASRFALLG